jgi:pyruvate/2-oxoglutarate dehydrogenase complex dihydrolipoamide acyltransferase (E2) component
MAEGAIMSWLVKDGESVAADQEIVEIEVEKATIAWSKDAGTYPTPY